MFNIIITALILIPVLIAYYNLLIVPQKRLTQNLNKIKHSLKMGNTITTTNNNCGKVLYIFSNTVIIEFENGIKSEILKQTIKQIHG
jgi:preprotein translocase YajC subunit